MTEINAHTEVQSGICKRETAWELRDSCPLDVARIASLARGVLFLTSHPSISVNLNEVYK